MSINLNSTYGGYGGYSGNVAPPNPQGQAGSGTAAASAGGSMAQAGSLAWWLAVAAGLVVLRIVIEVKGKVD